MATSTPEEWLALSAYEDGVCWIEADGRQPGAARGAAGARHPPGGHVIEAGSPPAP